MNKVLYVISVISILVFSSHADATGQLDDLPDIPYGVMLDHLGPADQASLRKVSRLHRDRVPNHNQPLINALVRQVNSWAPDMSSEKQGLTVARFSLPRIKLKSGEKKVRISPILVAALNEVLQRDGYLFVLENSPIEKILSQVYEFHFAAGRPSKAWAASYPDFNVRMLKILNMNIKDVRQRLPNIHRQLAACLPISRIYSDLDYRHDGVLDKFYKKNAEYMLSKLALEQELLPSFILVPPAYTEESIIQRLSLKPHNIIVEAYQLKAENSTCLSILNKIMQPGHPHSLTVTVSFNEPGGVLCLRKEELPTHVRSLCMMDTFECCDKIGREFLLGHQGIESVYFRRFHDVETIGSHFLRECSNLARIEMVGFNLLEEIGKCFLYGCPLLNYEYTDKLGNQLIALSEV